MLSIDLFDSKYEKKLHEGAVDDTIAQLLKPLSLRAADIRTQLRSGKLSPKQIAKLEQEYEALVQKRLDIILDRKPTQEQQSQPPAKGLLKGKDLVSPQQRVAGATPAKPGLAGAVKDVAGGVKRWLKGEPDQGPTYEAYVDPAGQANPRITGNANMGLLIKANSFKQVRPVTFEFPNMAPVPLDAHQTELISDYYDGLGSSGGQSHFIYNVLSSYEEVERLMTKLGAPLKKQTELLPQEPGSQGQLPLSEKKKSNSDDLEAGDIKVARELQKLRAQYPAARSDVEAVARAEIDSSERNQQQLAAIRGANEKQDALLKQLVALDQEQGREINNLDKENNSLEKELARIQATNSALAQTVTQMTGSKKSSRSPGQANTINLIPGAPADVKTPAQPRTKPRTEPRDEPRDEPTSKERGPEVFQQMTRTITRPPSAVSNLKSLRDPANTDQFQLTGTEESVNEHGGGIGPRQHWQSLMQETVADVRAGMAEIYHRLAPKIERHRDSFLAGQLYDELENYAELHGAEGEFKRMMATARGRAHMEYDTNPGGFHNWFWFLPFEDKDVDEAISKKDLLSKLQKNLPKVNDPKNKHAKPVNWTGPGKDDYGYTGYQGHGMPTDKQDRELARKKKGVAEGFEYGSKVQHPKYGSGQVVKVYSNGQITVNFPNYPDPIDKKPGVQSNFMPGDSGYQSLKSGIAESTNDIKKRMSKLEALALAANRAGDDAKCKMYQQKIQSLKQKLSQSMAEGWSDQGNLTPYSVYIDGREWRAYKSDEHARAVAEKVRANLERQGRKQTVTIAPSKTKKVQESDEQLLEGIKDTASATAVIACLLTGGSLSGCATAPQQTSAQQVLKTGQDIGRTVQTAKKITRAGTEAEVQQELRNILRGINRPEELNNSNIIRIWKRIKGQPPVAPEPQAPEYGPAEPVRRPATEAKEIVSKEDFLKERDRLLRMIGQETNPANKQILKSAIRQLENRAEQEGWITIQTRMMREDSDNGEAVEMAIMRRMLVAHTDLIVEFGLDKVVQAIEEVAYNVGDTDEIGSSDVSTYVHQVRQILGAAS